LLRVPDDRKCLRIRVATLARLDRVEEARALVARRADGSIVVGKLLESGDANWGFDAQAGEYTDLVARGVIDPAKVVRTALQDAASMAGLLITTEAMVAERPQKKEPAVPGGGGMGDMDF
jgi:chaperonin GroEL